MLRGGRWTCQREDFSAGGSENHWNSQIASQAGRRHLYAEDREVTRPSVSSHGQHGAEAHESLYTHSFNPKGNCTFYEIIMVKTGHKRV